MFSWTIDNREYFAPMGYGEISIERYATYMALLGESAYIEPKRQAPERKGFMARLIRRLNKANERLKQPIEDANVAWAKEYQAKQDFVAYWLRAHDVIDRIDPGTVMQIWEFLNSQWSVWKPKTINQFVFEGTLYTIDYTFEALSSIHDYTNLQSVMSQLCKDQDGKSPSSRAWGNLSLDVAASIMHTIKTKHKTFATIIGASILDHFKIQQQ